MLIWALYATANSSVLFKQKKTLELKTVCVFHNKSSLVNVISIRPNSVNPVYVNRIIQFSSFHHFIQYRLLFKTRHVLSCLPHLQLPFWVRLIFNKTVCPPPTLHGPNGSLRGERSATDLLSHSTTYIICTHINPVTDTASYCYLPIHQQCETSVRRAVHIDSEVSCASMLLGW